jgi:hypothetical protein
MILGVREVLIGDDDHWYDSTAGSSNNIDITTRAAVVKLPDPTEESHELDPVLGKRVIYLPDGTQPFCLESFPDENLKVNAYDAQVFANLVTFNAAAAYVLGGIDTTVDAT